MASSAGSGLLVGVGILLMIGLYLFPLVIILVVFGVIVFGIGSLIAICIGTISQSKKVWIYMLFFSVISGGISFIGTRLDFPEFFMNDGEVIWYYLVLSHARIVPVLEYCQSPAYQIHHPIALLGSIILLCVVIFMSVSDRSETSQPREDLK